MFASFEVCLLRQHGRTLLWAVDVIATRRLNVDEAIRFLIPKPRSEDELSAEPQAPRSLGRRIKALAASALAGHFSL